VSLINAIIFGIVEGLTEFLPVSSNANVRIVGALLGADPGVAFTAIIQLGAGLAMVVYFWPDIVRIVSAWFRSLFGRAPRNHPDARLGWFIIIGSIPVVVVGLLFQDAIETTLRSLWIIAGTLIGFGILLGIADLIGAKRRRMKELTFGHAIVIGLAQALAIIPGVSRSGGTITAGLFLGYERRDAFKYSFLLAIPVVVGSGLYQLYKGIEEPCVDTAVAICSAQQIGVTETVVATVISFIVGLAAVTVFMRYITRHSFLPFVIYRILLGGALVVMLSTGVLEA